MKNRAAAIIIRNRLLLVFRRHKPGRDYYSLPGGGVELEESFEEACRREVKEETGLDVVALQLVRKYITLEKEENYFLVRVADGEPVLGGPEVEHQSADNQYIFEWVDEAGLESIHLLPEAARRICLEAFHMI
jgi:8-oxo-dGTP diphosphatase